MSIKELLRPKPHSRWYLRALHCVCTSVYKPAVHSGLVEHHKAHKGWSPRDLNYVCAQYEVLGSSSLCGVVALHKHNSGMLAFACRA
jgi:hypothetical protein